MSAGDVGTIVAVVAAAVGLPALLMFLVKERRKNRAASEVAERTVEVDVGLRDTALDDARLLHAIAAFDAERSGYQHALAARDREIIWQREQIEHKDDLLRHRDEVIERLRGQVEELLGRLAEATRELHGVRIELAQLAAEAAGSGDGPVPA